MGRPANQPPQQIIRESDLDTLEAFRAKPELKLHAAGLKDREWRLDNLYWIQDADGLELPFRRNEPQLEFCKEAGGRSIICKARQLGFSTEIAIEMLDDLIFRKNMTCGIIDLTLDDAAAKLKKIRYAYDRLPAALRARVSLTKGNMHELEFSNGSAVSVGTSHRGGTLQFLHISEFGKLSVDSPDAAREVRKGAFGAAERGRIVVESTAHGTSGDFYDMVKAAERKEKEGQEFSRLDFRLHFFPWWKKRSYRIHNNLVVVTRELHDYFDELKAKHGIVLDADQKAWYTKMRADLGPDDMREEYPSTIEETFFNSLEGAYWKAEMTRARLDKRVGHPVPYDPTRLVNTSWDIGEDGTAIIFHQTDGVRHRIVDYFEVEGGSLQFAAGVLDDKQRDRGFRYGVHYGPHDLDHKDWGNNSKTRKEMAKDVGITFKVIPRVHDKGDSIEAARRLLAMTWIDSEHCERLVQCLDNYRKRWNKSNGVWMPEPQHNWFSHGADGYQCLAMGYKPEPEKREARPKQEQKGSAWAV